jgi:hypothetical protein
MAELRFTVTVTQTLGGVLRRADVDKFADHLAQLLAGEHHVNHMDMTVRVIETWVVRP